jgi:hypothetical protein
LHRRYHAIRLARAILAALDRAVARAIDRAFGRPDAERPTVIVGRSDAEPEYEPQRDSRPDSLVRAKSARFTFYPDRTAD